MNSIEIIGKGPTLFGRWDEERTDDDKHPSLLLPAAPSENPTWKDGEEPSGEAPHHADHTSKQEEEDFHTSIAPQLRCLQYCSLFPYNYEFDEDDLIQLWLAQDFIPNTNIVDQEDTANTYFQDFLSESVFIFSGHDRRTGRPRYKLRTSELKDDSIQYIKLQDPRDLIYVSKNTLHLSMHFDAFDQLNSLSSDRIQTLSTLLLFHQHLSSIQQLPWDLFLKLGSLRVLDLSHSNLQELPITVGNLKHLRYLDLSGTLITSLPDSLCSLYQLQTLKLKDCLELVDLPRGVRKLFNLRHLELDVTCLLNAMPLGVGDLVQLRTLPAFVVGKEDGCRISELKDMVNLRGSLSILRLENVRNVNEASEARIDEKKHLDHLEFKWTEFLDGFELLENLRPHTNLEKLQIVGYGGASFPSWIGDLLFSKLVSITLHDCKKSELLPHLGKLPLLRYLSITKMPAVKIIDGQFFGREVVTGFLNFGRVVLGKVTRPLSKCYTIRAFPSLENLRFQGMLGLERWTGLEEGDLPLLQKLSISSSSKLTALPELSLLKSLEELEISHCPLLQSIPNKGLPVSLVSLIIIDCPLLKERCLKVEGEDWHKIAHIPNVSIDYQQILQ